MKTKICTKCKIEKSVLDFYKDNRTNVKSKYRSSCIACDAEYRKRNVHKTAKRSKKYYEKKTEEIAERDKKYYKKNVNKIRKRQQDNKEHIVKQRKEYRSSVALFKPYATKLHVFEEVQSNEELLEVKCAYCGRWMKPTNLQVYNRLKAFNATTRGEHRFYCSENCKQACPIYGQKKYPKGFKKATSREVVPLLRQLVLKRDNHLCQKCGVGTKDAQLHVHHVLSYKLNKMVANDPDSCITLCKGCHKWVHSQDGCRYSDLKCK